MHVRNYHKHSTISFVRKSETSLPRMPRKKKRFKLKSNDTCITVPLQALVLCSVYCIWLVVTLHSYIFRGFGHGKVADWNPYYVAEHVHFHGCTIVRLYRYGNNNHSSVLMTLILIVYILF